MISKGTLGIKPGNSIPLILPHFVHQLLLPFLLQNPLKLALINRSVLIGKGKNHTSIRIGSAYTSTLHIIIMHLSSTQNSIMIEKAF